MHRHQKGGRKTKKKHPNTHEVLTVFLSLYAELDIIVILYSLRSIIHMLTLDVGLQKPAHHTVINSSQRVLQKDRKREKMWASLPPSFLWRASGWCLPHTSPSSCSQRCPEAGTETRLSFRFHRDVTSENTSTLCLNLWNSPLCTAPGHRAAWNCPTSPTWPTHTPV